MHGIRLGDLLERTWPDLDRAALRRLVADGRAKVNADLAGRARRLRAGDVVEVSFPTPPEQMKRHARPRDESALACPVLFQDDRVLVVDKPSGLASAPNKSGRDTSVVETVARDGTDRDLRVPFRLDKGTSGCVVLADGVSVARDLEAAFEAGRFQVEYLLLVQGNVRWREREVRESIGPDPSRPGRIRTVDPRSKGAREAVTQLTVEAQFRTHSLVRARPMTWRNHQIPVHLAFVGHPVVADREYGLRDHLLLSEIKKNYKARRGVVERPLLQRTFSHVERVTLPRIDGGSVDVVAPLAEDLATVIAKLRSFAPPPRRPRGV